MLGEREQGSYSESGGLCLRDSPSSLGLIHSTPPPRLFFRKKRMEQTGNDNDGNACEPRPLHPKVVVVRQSDTLLYGFHLKQLLPV